MTITVMTAEERERMMGEIRQAHVKAFEAIGEAGADACLIVSVKLTPDKQAAVVAQAKGPGEDVLSRDQMLNIVLKSLSSVLLADDDVAGNG